MSDTKTVIPQGSTIAEVAARSADVEIKTPTKERIDNTALLAETGLKILHFLPRGYDGACTAMRRGVTIAYRPINKNVIEVSTAVCHSQDQFSKKLGTKLAIENFQNGVSILVPATIGESYQSRLMNMFNY